MTEKSFGARLRAERERQGIALSAIALSTKINIALFEALERDDASRWPSGIFRRAFIRAYAKEIGLDPESTVREFLERFPDEVSEPHASVPNNDSPAASHDPSSTDAGALRLTLADDAMPFISTHRWPGWLRRVAAAVTDVAIVVGIAAVVFAFAGRVWAPFSVATMCYYFSGVAALGHSFGGWLVARTRRTIATDWRPTPMQLQSTAASVNGADNLRQFHPRRKVV
jgi:transcriptional regulator with XRE-family HTH domain